MVLLHAHASPAKLGTPSTDARRRGCQRAALRVTRRQPASQRATRATRPFAVLADAGEVDPRTGVVIATTGGVVPSERDVNAGGITWHVRETAPAPSAVSAGDMLCLHGILANSYSYRGLLPLLANQGFRAMAPDWVGHGQSSKPSPAAFAYTEAAYVAALSAFVAASGLASPFVLCVQGYVLGQYALLWALQNKDKVSKLVVLNTPVSRSAKLPGALAAYKRPGPLAATAGSAIRADLYVVSGSNYAMKAADAEVYQAPYSGPEAPASQAAIAATMAGFDLKATVSAVDDGFRTWRTPSLLAFGPDDNYLSDPNEAASFLETKRTAMRNATFVEQIGHTPQEDFPEAVAKKLAPFLGGTLQPASKTGYGGVR